MDPDVTAADAWVAGLFAGPGVPDAEYERVRELCRMSYLAGAIDAQRQDERHIEIIDGLTDQLGMLTEQLDREVADARRQAVEARRIYWMIERATDSQPQWWDGQHSESFTANPQHAVQFSRREDARTIVRTSVHPSVTYTLTEHADVLQPRPGAEKEAM